MELWQYSAVVNGYVEAHTPDKKKRMADSDTDALAEWIGA